MTQKFHCWVYISEKKSGNLKRYMHPNFIDVLFTVVKIWKQTSCPSTDKWIKIWFIYTMEYFSNVDRLEALCFSEINQTDKDKYCMLSHIQNLKYTKK